MALLGFMYVNSTVLVGVPIGVEKDTFTNRVLQSFTIHL